MEAKIEKFRLLVFHYITEELLKDLALPPVLDISLHAKWSADTIALRVTQEVYGENLGTLEIQRPATVFEMWKEKHAPFWFRRRWPVRYDTESYKAQVLYPKMACPEEVHNYTWIKEYE